MIDQDPTRIFGATKRRVAAIGQGSWNIEQAAADSAIAALQRGLDLGLTHIDTAEMYGSGASESLIAKAIAGRRDEVFLVSKVLPSNASKRGTLAACEKSLARLRTDRLDCYLLHWRGAYPLEETIAAFDALVRAGKILSWGVSNFDVADLDEAQFFRFSKELLHVRVAIGQNFWVLDIQESRHGIRDGQLVIAIRGIRLPADNLYLFQPKGCRKHQALQNGIVLARRRIFHLGRIEFGVVYFLIVQGDEHNRSADQLPAIAREKLFHRGLRRQRLERQRRDKEDCQRRKRH